MRTPGRCIKCNPALCVPITSSSCDQVIFVDQATDVSFTDAHIRRAGDHLRDQGWLTATQAVGSGRGLLGRMLRYSALR